MEVDWHSDRTIRETTDLGTVELTDFDGNAHLFHCRTRAFGADLALDATEIRDGVPAGYEFQILGRANDDPLELLQTLTERMQRALAVRHVEMGSLGLRIAGRVVRGRIGWDQDALPLLTVDGQNITWDEFGRMLMSFEGWQFKLEMRDKSEEL